MTESVLIKKAKAGNQRAFKKLYDWHMDGLFRFLCQFSKDINSVEEWTQRAFINAFKNIHRFEGRSKFATWLYKIGINEMRNDFSRKQIFTNDSIDDLELYDNKSMEEEFEWRSEMKQVLALLDDNKKAVFILFEIEGYSHSEIAEMLQISEESSRTTLSRTKSFLRSRWKVNRGLYDK